MVTHTFERLTGRGIKSATLRHDEIGQPLVVETACIDCFFQVHAEFGHVQKDLKNGGDDCGTAWRAKYHKELTFFFNNGRRHRTEHAFVGLYGIGFRAN